MPRLWSRVTPALADFTRCVRTSAGLAARGRLASPDTYVGARLHFADGTSSLVFRETALRGGRTSDPAVLVIQFRLAALGSNGFLHAAFRRECILHTPLFAGFPGFRSKLWADDVDTGVYRGLYEWQDPRSATHYAQRMVALLAPFSNAGTARYHVIAQLRRDEFVADPHAASGGPADGWWRLAYPVTVQPAHAG
jgi:hypothetical protein